MEIRYATHFDLERIMEIEALTFPAAEAAKRETFAYRVEHFSEWFFVALEEGRVVALLCARPSAQGRMTDALYEPEELPAGDTLAVLCLETDPAHQKRGVAAALLRHAIGKARDAGVRALMLACKAPLVPYYERFGFALLGASASAHGGARWLDMALALSREQPEAR